MGMLFRRSPAGTPSASTAAPAPQAGAAAQGEPVGGRGVRRLYDVLLFAPMLPVVLIVAVGFSLSVEGFATWANAQNMMRGLAVITIASLGATYVFLIGGLDLSVGATIS